MIRRFWSAILVLCFVVVGLVAVPTSSSSASTTSYNNLELTPELFVYTNGAAKSQTLDISTTWWADIKQAYERRMVYTPSGWPTNFVSTVDDAIANGGSWGVIQVESPYGNEIRMFATDDPNATCTIQPYVTDWWLECVGTTPGYSFVSADYITHNSFGSNGCGGGSCSDNGMNIYNAPTVYAAGGGRWDQRGDAFDSGHAKIFFLNVDVVYPTGYTGPEIPHEFSPLEYVALGDSFSSGEGVEPFELGTDVSDDLATTGVDEENRCHRSEDAYPRLLAEDPRLGLQLNGFVACSGATTDMVLNGGSGSGAWSESPQVNALSESTDIVTITIGGNDVGFGDTLKKCIFSNEMPETWENTQEAYDRHTCAQEIETSQGRILGYDLLGGGHTFEEKITLTLSTILGKIGPQTQIYVIGYPNLFDEYENFPAPGTCTWGVVFGIEGTSNRTVFSEEVTLLRQVTGQLVSALSSSVADIDDDRLHFLDIRTEFAGHEICGTGNDYLHQIYVPVRDGSYHPNSDGHTAYSNKMKGELD